MTSRFSVRELRPICLRYSGGICVAFRRKRFVQIGNDRSRRGRLRMGLLLLRNVEERMEYLVRDWGLLPSLVSLRTTYEVINTAPGEYVHSRVFILQLAEERAVARIPDPARSGLIVVSPLYTFPSPACDCDHGTCLYV